MRTIVVGYVPKPEGEAALDHSLAEARARGARVVVVASAARSRSLGGIADRVTGRHEDAEEAPDLAERLAASEVEHELRRLGEHDDPATEIVAAVEETGADLLVIGLRRRSPVGKLVLGSHAQRLLLDAPCPVLAVKP